MNRPTFLNILQANAGGGTTIVNNLLEHMKDEKNPIMEKIVEEIENIVGQGRTDLLTLYFAALRGEGLSVNASRRNNYPARVTISCSYKAELEAKQGQLRSGGKPMRGTEKDSDCRLQFVRTSRVKPAFIRALLSKHSANITRPIPKKKQHHNRNNQ
ncbi:RAC-alpha serine/threonine-protein kinase [Ancistrocladus abbreviatus]